jgi:hypothetical protein
MRRHARRILVRSEGKRPLPRPSHRREDNIKFDLREIGGDGKAGLIWFRIGTSGRLL